MGDRGWPAWAGIVVAVAVSGFAIDAQGPPPALPADAPADAFSAGRARVHVAEIAEYPHPTGSDEARHVRDLIVSRLEALGLTPVIQASENPDLPLRNILVRLKGRGPSGKKALLLCCHYDTVPYSPGAGDDASGVAVILETLRALRAGPAPDRDVIALFDDGEERGLCGADFFVAEHAWARDVGVVLNFDARGGSGPSIMFETSEGNGWLIRQYARAVRRPLATSLSMDVYRIMPNDTDLTVFKRAGKSGLNFAFAGSPAHYHTPQDTPANLDPRTLQHHGDNALALARRLGNLDLDDTRRDDVIYTSVLNRWVLFYPRRLALPLAWTAAALFAIVVGIGLRAGRLRFVDLAAGAGVWLAAATAAIFAVGAFKVVLDDMLSEVGVRLTPIEMPIMAVCTGIAAVATLTLERRSARRRPLEALGLGALAWWVAGALATAAWLPGASYLLAWPSLFLLAGWGVALASRPWSARGRVAILLGSVPSLLLLPPLIRLTFDGLGVRLAAPSMILVVLFLGAILPLLGPIVVPGRRA